MPEIDYVKRGKALFALSNQMIADEKSRKEALSQDKESALAQLQQDNQHIESGLKLMQKELPASVFTALVDEKANEETIKNSQSILMGQAAHYQKGTQTEAEKSRSDMLIEAAALLDQKMRFGGKAGNFLLRKALLKIPLDEIRKRRGLEVEKAGFAESVFEGTLGLLSSTASAVTNVFSSKQQAVTDKALWESHSRDLHKEGAMVGSAVGSAILAGLGGVAGTVIKGTAALGTAASTLSKVNAGITAMAAAKARNVMLEDELKQDITGERDGTRVVLHGFLQGLSTFASESIGYGIAKAGGTRIASMIKFERTEVLIHFGGLKLTIINE